MDKVIIRDNYLSMANDHLLEFAKREGLALSPDAFSMLCNELRNRKIGEEVIAELEEEIINRQRMKQKEIQTNFLEELTVYAYAIALELKANRQSDYMVHQQLQQFGIKSDSAFQIIKNLPTKAGELNDNAENELTMGIIIAIAGLACTYIGLGTGNFMVFGLSIAFCGVLNSISAAHNKCKYQRIVNFLLEEKE